MEGILRKSGGRCILSFRILGLIRGQSLPLGSDADPEITPNFAEIVRYLTIRDIYVNVLCSHQSCLGILPIRATKGTATRFLAVRWGTTLPRTRKLCLHGRR